MSTWEEKFNAQNQILTLRCDQRCKTLFIVLDSPSTNLYLIYSIIDCLTEDFLYLIYLVAISFTVKLLCVFYCLFGYTRNDS